MITRREEKQKGENKVLGYKKAPSECQEVHSLYGFNYKEKKRTQHSTYYSTASFSCVGCIGKTEKGL